MDKEENIILDIKVKYADAIKSIADARAEIDKLKATQKAYIQDHKQSVKDRVYSEEEYQKAMAATDQQIKAYRNDVNVLSRQIQNQVKEQKAADGSLQEMCLTLARMKKEYKDLGNTEEKDIKRKKELEGEINKLTNDIKKQEEAIQVYGRNVGNYYGSIMDAMADLQHVVPLGGGGGVGEFASSVQSLASAADGAIPKIKAFGSTILTLLSNPAFLALGGVAGAGMAFKWFYDYNLGLMEATRLTKEFTGLTGDELVSVRNEIQATADAMGTDYKETLQTIDALMANYGISAQEATKIVEDGFASGANLSGDMLSKMQQFAPTFHDAGISAKQMTAIIAQTRSGIFSDKGMEIITMASKKIREMSTATKSALKGINIDADEMQKGLQNGTISTFDVIQKVSTNMKQFGADSEQVGAVLKDVFGKQGANAGIKLIEQLDTMSTDLDKVKEQTGEWGKAQKELIDANTELNGVISGLFDLTDNGFAGWIAQGKLFGTKVLTQILKGVMNLINYFIDLYNNSTLVRAGVQSIVTQFKIGWEVIKLFFNLVVDGFKNIGRQIKGFGSIMEGFLTFDAKKIRKGFGEVLTSNTKMGVEMVKDFKKFGQNSADAYIDGLKNTFAAKPIAKLSVQAGIEGNGGVGDTKVNGNGASPSKSTKDTAKAAKERAKAAQNAAKEEEEAVKRANELLSKIQSQSFDDMRRNVEESYNDQIAIVRKKLSLLASTEVTTRKAYESQIVSLEKLKVEELAKLSEKELAQRVDIENRRLSLLLNATKGDFSKQRELKLQELANTQELEEAKLQTEQMSEEQREELLLAMRIAYKEKQKEIEGSFDKQMHDEMMQQMQNEFTERMMLASNNEVEQAQIQVEQKKAILDNLQQMEGESDAAFYARKLQAQQDYQSAKKNLDDKEVAMEQAKQKAIADLIGGVRTALDALGDDNKGFAVASKILAISEVAIQQGIAIANAIRAAAEGSHSAWELAAQIAVSVGAVVASIVSATKSIKSAKFAMGGSVVGPGTGTSDSIPAYLSNGESVNNERATSMFAPLYSALNQMSGGAPIISQSPSQSIGMEMLADAFAAGASRLRLAVSVEEINNVNTKVEALERMARI